jgi:hypothetical protein
MVCVEGGGLIVGGWAGALRNVVKCGCLLDALLFIKINEDRGQKNHCFVALKSLKGPTLSHTRQVAHPPLARPYAMAHFAYASTL